MESGSAHHQVEIPKERRLKAEGDLLVGGFTEPDETGRVIFIPHTGWYYGFDTGDAERFKVTIEPFFTADAVTFRFRGDDNRVYLRPRLAGIALVDSVTGETEASWIARLAPVYPAPGSVGCALARSAYSEDPDPEAQQVAYLNIFTAVPGEETPVLRTLRAGSLVAAVAQGARVYYVWTVEGVRDEVAESLLSFGACGG